MADPTEKSDIEQMERRLEMLKFDYDQYFLGLHKLEPLKLRKQTTDLIRHYATRRISNTALSYRYRNICARFTSLSGYWDKTLRQIEDGSYKRDRFRLSLREKHGAARLPEAPSEQEMGQSDGGGAESGYRGLYEEYIKARLACGESVAGYSYEKIASTLESNEKQIMERYHCRAVTFRVVIENGKAKFKALPRNDGAGA